MKKLTTTLTAAALLLTLGLAGCGTTTSSAPSSEAPTSSSSSVAPSSSSSSSTSVAPSTTSVAPAVDIETLAKTALAQIGTSLSKYASSGATANFEVVVVSKVTGDDGKVYSFDILYSVDSAYADYLAVSDVGMKILVTSPNTLEGGTDQQCKLHANAYYLGKKYGESDFNILVKAVSKYTIKLLYTAKDGDGVTFKGKVTGLYGADYGTKGTYYTIFVGDGDYGVTVFSASLPDGAGIGSFVNVAGTVSIYSGLYEIKSGTVTLLAAADATDVATPTVLALKADNVPTIATNMASRPATITEGTVTSVAGSIGGNLTIKVKLGSVAYTVFENSTYCSADDYATFSQTRSGASAASIIAVNDIVDLTGFTSFYTNPQLVGAKITKWTEGVAPKDTPITIATLANSGWDTSVSAYVTQGFVTGYYAGIGTPKNGIFIADGDAGLDVYNYTGDCTAFPVGTCVTVVGVPSVFNGLIEFTANSIAATATADITAKAAVTAELAGKTGLTNSVVSRYAHVTGIVAKSGAENNKGTAPVAGTTNMNVTFTIGAGETINAYLPKWFDATTYNAFAALADGDMVELNGFIANYKSNTTTWSADLTAGLQIVAPTIVKVTAAASIVLATPTMTVAGAVAAAKGAAVDTIGIYEGSYPTNMYQGVFIGDGAASITTYKGAAFPVGMVKGVYLHVVGAAAPFNGLPELDISAGSISVLPVGTVAASVVTPVVNTTVSAALAATDLNHEFDITGAKVKSISKAAVAGSTDGTYVLTINSIDVTLFVKKTALDASVYTALAAAKVDDLLAFTAFGGQFVSNNVATYQLVAPSNVVVTPAD